MKKLPSYSLHKASGQAICRISGRVYYLGKFGSKESQDKFNQLVAQSLTDPTFGIKKNSVSVAEGCVSYLKFAKVYYRDGSEFVGMSDACKPLVELFSSVHLSDFGIPEFKACRQFWVNRGCSRQYVNKQVKRLLRLAKWWVSEGMVEPSLHQALKCVEPLKLGRCECPEAEPIKPVDAQAIEKTLPHLPPILRDLVKVHLLLGCRPGEVVKLTPSMIDRSGSVWAIRLADHKTSWRGHARTIYVGPKAQAILAPHLESCKPDEVIFSPTKATRQRLEAKSANRKTPLSCGNRPGSNKTTSPKKCPGKAYDTQSYGKAIRYACQSAGVDVWSPNQLRHAKATELRTAEGIESASLILGHKSLDVTQVYAEKSERLAIGLAAKYG